MNWGIFPLDNTAPYQPDRCANVFHDAWLRVTTGGVGCGMGGRWSGRDTNWDDDQSRHSPEEKP